MPDLPDCQRCGETVEDECEEYCPKCQEYFYDREEDSDLATVIDRIYNICKLGNLSIEVTENGHLEIWSEDETDLGKFVFGEETP